MQDTAHALLETIGLAPSRSREMHPQVVRAVALLRRRANDLPGGSELARLLGLSPDRFRHIFARDMNLPYRRYRLWLRLQTAVAHAQSGASLTEAAHAAGFADSSHLTRTFREMFGIAPSSVPPTVKATQAPLDLRAAAPRKASR